MRERPEKDIVLVAHGDFLRQITADKFGPSGHMWKNVEVRVFRFDEKSVGSEDCFFQFEEAVEGAQGYGWRSRELDVDGDLGVVNGINGKI